MIKIITVCSNCGKEQEIKENIEDIIRLEKAGENNFCKECSMKWAAEVDGLRKRREEEFKSLKEKYGIKEN